MVTNKTASIHFQHTIWKLVPDYENKYLVVELRNAEERSVYFALIYILKKQLLWSGFMLSEKWWTGIEFSSAGYIYFHGYQSTQFALHKGIYCFESLSKKLLWQKNEYRYLKHELNTITLQSVKDPDKIILVDKKTGMEISAEKSKVFESPSLPLLFSDSSKELDTVKVFINEKLNLEAISMVEYQEYDEKIVISFYHKVEGKFVNEILVINNNGNVALREEIGKNLEGFGKSTFFIFEGKLIFIKFNNELCIYDI